ncbi:MAG: hypothetical protein RL094_255 [Candidatus Parcubacteria bacterium]
MRLSDYFRFAVFFFVVFLALDFLATTFFFVAFFAFLAAMLGALKELITF